MALVYSHVPLLALPLHATPLHLLQYACDSAMAVFARRHRPLFERLAEFAGTRILIDAADLPIAFLLTLDPLRPALQACDRGRTPRADAAVRAPLSLLIDLMEGRIDGDALFFARDLTFSGDTQIVVALRNAIDGSGIDLLADLMSALGPLAGPGARLARNVAPLLGHMMSRIEAAGGQILAPIRRDVARQQAALVALQERLAALERRAPRPRTSP